MKATGFVNVLERVINETRENNGCSEKVRIIPCDVVQICSNGRHKDVYTGRFVK